jgi:hypothetical protein
MKTILLLLVFASLTLAQRSVVQKNRQLLLDFRVDRPLRSSKIPAATQRNVFAKVFRRYLTDDSKCKSEFDTANGGDSLEAARKAGQIVPSIFAVVNGSFTGTGQSQTAYVIGVGECYASHAENYGTKRVAIFSGQQLVADVDVDYRSGIALKTDLNTDGIDELLMTTGDMAQGTLIEMAALVSFKNGRFKVLHDFGTVVDDSCASAFPGSAAKASVLYISDSAPGKMPKLAMDNYVSKCRKAKSWRFLSTGKMPE